jgi:putative membrane protein
MPYRYGDHMDNGGWGAGWIVVMIIVMLILVALAVVVIWTLLGGPRRFTGESATQPTRLTPEQLLAERLARGDIDPDEYRTRLAALKEPNTGP